MQEIKHSVSLDQLLRNDLCIQLANDLQGALFKPLEPA